MTNSTTLRTTQSEATELFSGTCTKSLNGTVLLCTIDRWPVNHLWWPARLRPSRLQAWLQINWNRRHVPLNSNITRKHTKNIQHRNGSRQTLRFYLLGEERMLEQLGCRGSFVRVWLKASGIITDNKMII